jgi:hypothetical protein
MTDKQDGKGSGYVLPAIVLTTVVFAAYMGAYYALLAGSVLHPTFTPAPMSWEAPARGGPLPRVVFPVYRHGGSFAKQVFRPAHELDRKLRADKWGQP